MTRRRWARSSRSMKPGFQMILARWFVGLSKEMVSMPCWMLRPTSFAEEHVTNVAKLAGYRSAMNWTPAHQSAGEVNLDILEAAAPDL